MRRILPVVVLFGFVFLAYQISQSRPDSGAGFKKSPTKLKVEVMAVEAKDYALTIESFGTVQPRTQGGLFALVPGQVLEISPNFKAGGYFKKGDVLLQIDPVEYEVQLETARAEVAQAELSLADEQARFRQAKRDWEKQPDATQATDYALRKPHLVAAEAQLATAKANLKLAELNLSRTNVRAPYEGRIENTMVDVGSVVSSSLELARIHAIDRLEVRLPVKHRDIPFVDLPKENGTSAAIEAAPIVKVINKLYGKPQVWEGVLERTEASIDQSSQQLFVVASIERPFDQQGDLISGKDPLKIGQYVSADIQGRTIENKVVIPNSAIYQGHYVYIVEDEKLLRRDLDILWRDRDYTVLNGGIEAGDLLVTTSLGQVASGTLVTWDQTEDQGEGQNQGQDRKAYTEQAQL